MELLRTMILIECRESYEANNIVDDFVFRKGTVTALEIMTSAGVLPHCLEDTNLMTDNPDTSEYQPLEPPTVRLYVSGVHHGNEGKPTRPARQTSELSRPQKG